jgi:methylenetetrahydrofolate--tRNA-(uracil-5-)-methyltransferase
LADEIIELTGDNGLHFYDAAAPIVQKDSIDMNIAFWGDRYEQERGKNEDIDEWKKRIEDLKEADYINLPMNKEEYENFVKELVNAEVVELHEFEKREIFEGCMPIEIMAKRGLDTLRFGPLKPVGFTDPRTGFRPYAIVQLRQDNTEGTIYNIVGFQTNLKFGEQKRVFSMIPGLEKAEFAKYGVMHRNTFINSPELLDETYNFKKNNNIYFAGQITGVEGYVESISSGLVAGINACLRFNKCDKMQTFDEKTMIGALAKYISTDNNKFQPMNANFGILPELDEKIRDKKERYGKLADRSIDLLKLDKNIDVKSF